MTSNVTIDLGKVKFHWRGNYSASTAYKKDDVTYHSSSAWVAVADVTGVTPSASATEWDLMVEGADINSILTTSGDLLVRGSSGLERLAKGSVGDVLKVGSSGLEYGQSVQAGQILETLTGVCDGSQVTVASGTYTMPNVTSYQALNTDYQNLSGTLISYTPPAGTTRVKYHFDATIEDQGYGGISHYRFYIDGVQVNKAYRNLSFQYDANAHGMGRAQLSWVIPCNATTADASYGRFTSWTSPKTLKWMGRNYDGSYRMRWHMNTWEDGTGSSGSEQWTPPILTITAYA